MDDLHSEESKAVQKSVDGESLLSHLQAIDKVLFLNIQIKLKYSKFILPEL